jgi:hypothetical protein
MSSTAVQGRTDGGIHRRVEHIMGMPISLALRGPPHRHYRRAPGLAGSDQQLREVDQIFSTYRTIPSASSRSCPATR